MKPFPKKRFFQRTSVREAAKAAAFLLLLALVFSAFCRFFSFKYNDGIYNLEALYAQEEDSIDVLFLGSSHAFESFHTGVLYEEYGVAAFDLGSSEQPLWNSYHYLLEALKTQTPKLVVLEGYSLPYDGEHQVHDRLVKNTAGFRPSLNQLENLRVSAPEDEFWTYFFRFYTYHNRYDENISSADYYPRQGMAIYDDWKGFLFNHYNYYYDTPHALGLTGTMELHPKTETYYRKVIELCQSRGIPLHVVVVPYHMTDTEQLRMNRAAEIAAEYGVPFTDYNGPGMHEMLDFDYSRDMAHGNHLNPYAAIRFTRALGDMLTATYDLPDRRGDERYASWARSATYHRRDLANHELAAIAQLEPYLHHLAQDPDYTAVFSITGYLADYFDQIVSMLEPFGVYDILYPHAMNGTWVSRGGEVLVRFASDNRYPYIELDNQTITLAQDHALTGKKPVRLTEKGLNIIVYDHVTRTIVDTVGFDALRGFAAVRPD